MHSYLANAKWFLIGIYIVPIIGTMIHVGRGARLLWPFGRIVRLRISLDRYLDINAVNLVAGRMEYSIGHVRDYTIGVAMTFIASVYFSVMFFGGHGLEAEYFYPFLYCAVFSLLSLYSYKRHVATGVRMTEFARANPLVDPREWYDYYYRHIGFMATPVPNSAKTRLDPENIDFSTGKPPMQGLFPLIRGVYDTAIMARSAYRTLRFIGYRYGRDVFDAMASLWGAHILQVFNARMKVTGSEKLTSLPGKIILVFNHKSHIDFVLAFYALSSVRIASGRRVRVRYLVAKDHFIDNKIVYDGIGVGRLIEAVDMIFVDRQGKGVDAIEEAAKTLIEKDVEVSVFPQGTRAFSNNGPKGERRDAGYYTTGTARALKQERGYIKKGTSFLALDSAIAISSQNIPVHIVCIGIEGTADIVPKMGTMAQTEASIRFTVGRVITIDPEDVANMKKPREARGDSTVRTPQEENYLKKIEEIRIYIDEGLREALDLHNKLLVRFMGDIKTMGLVSPDRLPGIKENIIQLEREGVIYPFIIIDRIYALHLSYWNEHLRALAVQMSTTPDIDSLIGLKDKITDFLFETRGKEMARIMKPEDVKRAVFARQ